MYNSSCISQQMLLSKHRCSQQRGCSQHFTTFRSVCEGSEKNEKEKRASAQHCGRNQMRAERFRVHPLPLHLRHFFLTQAHTHTLQLEIHWISTDIKASSNWNCQSGRVWLNTHAPRLSESVTGPSCTTSAVNIWKSVKAMWNWIKCVSLIVSRRLLARWGTECNKFTHRTTGTAVTDH